MSETTQGYLGIDGEIAKVNHRRNCGQSPLPRAVYQPPFTGDAGMVGTTRDRSQLCRYLLRYTRR